MSADRFEWKVDIGRQRLDVWLSGRKPPGLSRSGWQRLIEGGHVLVNGRPAARDLQLQKGDEVKAAIPPPEKSQLEAEEIPLEILYEDEDLLVINKPAGLVVHPGAGHRRGTLVQALLHHCRGRLSGIGGVERPGLVHRLDADTSGCLVVAKNDAAHDSLASQFKSRTVEKIYLACVWGEPRQAGGRIQTMLGRHPAQRKKMSVLPAGRGKEAVTEWKVRESLGKASLLECRLLTGRTHQIRVHCAHLGHAIVGDKVYGGGFTPSRSANLPGVPPPARQLLHAWKLAFRHPRTSKMISIEAPVPDDMNAFASRLRLR